MADKKLKTVEEHNAERQRKYSTFFVDKKDPAGVECPVCGREMVFKDDTALASWPPQRAVICESGCAQSVIIV